jgi:hypothetical protein
VVGWICPSIASERLEWLYSLSVFRDLSFCCLASYLTLKMEAVLSFETSTIFYHTTRCQSQKMVLLLGKNYIYYVGLQRINLRINECLSQKLIIIKQESCKYVLNNFTDGKRKGISKEGRRKEKKNDRKNGMKYTFVRNSEYIHIGPNSVNWLV